MTTLLLDSVLVVYIVPISCMCDDDVIVCYNKNPVSCIVSSCYTYFGVVTETGGLSMREKKRKKIRRGYKEIVQASAQA